MIVVLDSSAILAYFRGEPSGELVVRTIRRRANTCYAHAVNLCEVFYESVRTEGERAANAILRITEGMGVITRDDLDEPFWRQAGRVKANIAGLSLADCFAVALAERVRGTVLTADHEFDRIVAHGVCPVRFIR